MISWLEDHTIGLIFGALAVFVAIVVIGGAVSLSTDARCQAKGWPGSNVTWNLHRYCIKRIQQTDSVVPLATLERAR